MFYLYTKYKVLFLEKKSNNMTYTLNIKLQNEIST